MASWQASSWREQRIERGRPVARLQRERCRRTAQGRRGVLDSLVDRRVASSSSLVQMSNSAAAQTTSRSRRLKVPRMVWSKPSARSSSWMGMSTCRSGRYFSLAAPACC